MLIKSKWMYGESIITTLLQKQFLLRHVKKLKTKGNPQRKRDEIRR